MVGEAHRRWQLTLDDIRRRIALARVFAHAQWDAVKHAQHSRYLKTLKAGVHSRMAANNTLLDVKVRRARKLAVEAICSGLAITATASQGSQPAFWQQGDAALASEENLRRRFRLRSSRAVVDALEAFWNAAVSHNGAVGTIAGVAVVDNEHQLKVNGDGCVDKASYYELYSRIYKVMLVSRMELH